MGELLRVLRWRDGISTETRSREVVHAITDIVDKSLGFTWPMNVSVYEEHMNRIGGNLPAAKVVNAF